MKGHVIFEGEINYNEIAKMNLPNLRIFFYKTCLSISTKPGILGEGYKVCSNEGARHFPMGDNNKIHQCSKKNTLTIFLKSPSPEPLVQIQLNLA